MGTPAAKERCVVCNTKNGAERVRLYETLRSNGESLKKA